MVENICGKGEKVALSL